MGKGRLLTISEVLRMNGEYVYFEANEKDREYMGIYRFKKFESSGSLVGDGARIFHINSTVSHRGKFYEYIEEPKTYKTSEMIAMLEENPKLKFKCLTVEHDASYNSVSVKNGVICWGGDSEFSLHVVVDEDKDTWTLIEEPKEVTFMEAFNKWVNENKTIRVEFDGGQGHYYYPTTSAQAIPREEILNGKWYIMEESK